MNAISLRQQADRRAAAAVAEGLEQLRNGWKPAEIVAVLQDAAGPIAELRAQAEALQMQARAERRSRRIRAFTAWRAS